MSERSANVLAHCSTSEGRSHTKYGTRSFYN